MRRDVMVAYWAHNSEVVGSIPASATKKVDKCYNQPYKVDINTVKLKVYLQNSKD